MLELINGPLSLYWAPVGEAFPLVDDPPAGNWLLIGTSGDKNYTEDGVIMAFDSTHEMFRPLGSPFARKAFLTESDIFVRVSMADMSLAQLRLAFNLEAVVVDAGPPAIESLSLDISGDVNDMALLVRGEGKSPQFATGGLQLELNRVIETGQHEITSVKGDAANVQLEFQALLDSSNNVGRFVVQTA